MICQLRRKAAELPVQSVQIGFTRIDLKIRQAGFLINHFIIPGERRKRGKLRRTVMKAHVRTDRRLMVRKIENVRIDNVGRRIIL